MEITAQIAAPFSRQDRYGDYGLVACAFCSTAAEAALVECLRREINLGQRRMGS